MIRLIGIILAAVGIVSSTDYCSSSLCGRSQHIGCNNNGAFGSKCASSRQLVGMTDTLKDSILNSHNSKRNEIASGSLPGYRSATRMATMKWSDELAKLAELNVKRCQFGHDSCHNTDEFKYSGQNIAATWTSAANIDPAKAIPPLIDSWWSEYKSASMNDINSYPSQQPSKAIGHFTVMTADKNIAVGCAAIKYPDPSMNNWNALLLTCNYATTNIVGRRMFESGNTGSKCTTGRNPKYSGLCSSSEWYDVNKI